MTASDLFRSYRLDQDAHLIVSEYSEQKAKLLREIMELIETKNRELE